MYHVFMLFAVCRFNQKCCLKIILFNVLIKIFIYDLYKIFQKRPPTLKPYSGFQTRWGAFEKLYGALFYQGRKKTGVKGGALKTGEKALHLPTPLSALANNGGKKVVNTAVNGKLLLTIVNPIIQ